MKYPIRILNYTGWTTVGSVAATVSNLSIQGVSDGIPVAAYNVERVQIGYAVAADGNVVMNTNMKKGDVAIVKIGRQTKRVIMK